MKIREALSESFVLLRTHPRLFLPRLVLSVVWGFFWLAFVNTFNHPTTASVQHMGILLLVMLVLTPIQIWVYNAYFVIVEQYQDGTLHLLSAFRRGLHRLPQSIAVFFLLMILTMLSGTPGLILVTYGLMTRSILFTGIGLIIAAGAMLAVLLFSYFVPVSVVLGKKTFITNMLDGFRASNAERREVALLTALSFTTLLLTQLLHGGFAYLGILGFFGARFLAAVLSVYVLVVNPEMFLGTINEE